MRKTMLATFLEFASVLPESIALSGASPSVKQFSKQFFLVAPTFGAVQNEGHSTVIPPIQERTLCARQKS
jgi:hypothetical protein